MELSGGFCIKQALICVILIVPELNIFQQKYKTACVGVHFTRDELNNMYQLTLPLSLINVSKSLCHSSKKACYFDCLSYMSGLKCLHEASIRTLTLTALGCFFTDSLLL